MKKTLILVSLAVALGAFAGDHKTRYLVTAPHSAADCLASLDDVAKAKLLDKMDFGCANGDHTGYLVVDAASADDARKRLPESQRTNAKAVKLVKFNAEDLRHLHASK